MIITRSPLRISLGGGGTDLPSYYRAHGGFLSPRRSTSMFTSRSLGGSWTVFAEIRIWRKLKRLMRSSTIIGKPEARRRSGAEWKSPAWPISRSTGARFVWQFYDHRTAPKPCTLCAKPCSSVGLAEAQACCIELGKLGNQWKQDQYIAAYGRITCFHFLRTAPCAGVAFEHFRGDSP